MNEGELNRVLAEYIRRCDAGELVDVEALCNSHPDLADALRSYSRGEGLLAGLISDADSSGVESDASQMAETIRPGAGRRTDFAPNSEFGRYRILRLLGEGAMGAIYLAIDTNLDRQVALKIPKFSAAEGEEFRRRFARESRAAAQLDHPNICRVYDADEYAGTPFISMAYIDGQPLSRFVGTNEFKDQRRVAAVVRAIAAGLAHAHKQGILHRDLKPSNVLLQPNDIPCITDFGLARRVDAAEESRLTHEGTILGTPAYMSPEQVEGKAECIGPATDIYALGVALYELLTGQLPFQGSVMSILGQVLRDRPPQLSKLRGDVSPELEDLCLRMLEKVAARRPASMDAVVDELDRWLKKPGLQKPEPQKPAARDQSTRDRLEVMKGKILAYCERGQFAAAIAGLEKMTSIKVPEAAQYVAWACQQLPAVRKRPQQLRESVPALLATAQECMQRHDYAQAAELLQGIPQDYRTEPVRTVLSQAIELQEESDLLLADLQDCVQRRQYQGIRENLQRYLEIKPGSKFARDLRDALKSYGKVEGRRRKYKHDEKGRLLPMSTGSLWDSWLLWGAVCFAFVFGATTWAITIYLKRDDQTLAVQVDEEWLKEQGGQITLAVDGDDHAISGPDIDISVRLGEHGFSVRQGDTIVHSPKSFTIEKEGRKILRINKAGMSVDSEADVARDAATEDAAEWVDLLASLDFAKANTPKRIWRRDGNKVVGNRAPPVQDGDWLVVLLGQQIEGDYDFEMDVLSADVVPINLEMPAQDQLVMVILNSPREATEEQRRAKTVSLPQNTLQTLKVSVRNMGENCQLEAWLNGVLMGSFSGPRSSLPVPANPERNRIKIVGQVKDAASRIEIHRARLRRVNASKRIVAGLNNAPSQTAGALQSGKPAVTDAAWEPLFNGTDLSGWTHTDGQAPKWTVGDGYVEVAPRSGSIMTRKSFPLDVELHVEFWIPDDRPRAGQQRGNSGIYLHGRHEIQILDSFQNPEVRDAKTACGALYGQTGPTRRVEKGPETWQSFDITFRGPRSEGGKAAGPGRFSLVFNGQKVIDDAPISSARSVGSLNTDIGRPGPIMLQDHGSKVRFRNLRIRSLPSATE